MLLSTQRDFRRLLLVVPRSKQRQTVLVSRRENRDPVDRREERDQPQRKARQGTCVALDLCDFFLSFG